MREENLKKIGILLISFTFKYFDINILDNMENNKQ